MTAVATPPILYWDFETNKSLVPTIGSVTPACVRPNNASYYDTSGIIQVAAANTARWDHHPVTFASRGLFLEETRTNPVLGSSLNEAAYTAGYWAQTGTWANGQRDYLAATAPDGTLTATRIKDDNGNDGPQQIGTTRSHGLSANVNNIISYFVKADQHSKVGILTSSFDTSVFSYFNIGTGLFETLNHLEGFIRQLKDGWWRIGVRFNPGVDNNGQIGIFAYETAGTNTANTDGTSTFFAWGAMTEAGAAMSSYIPTTTASVTRTGDVCRVASGLTAVPVFPIGEGSYFSHHDTSYSHQASGAVVATGTPGLTEFEADGTMEITGVGGWNTASPLLKAENKMATGFNSTSQRTYGNGTPGALETNVWSTPHASPDVMTIGSRSTATLTGVLKYTGWIKKLAVWNTRLPDTDLDGLTDGTLLPYEPPVITSEGALYGWFFLHWQDDMMAHH